MRVPSRSGSASPSGNVSVGTVRFSTIESATMLLPSTAVSEPNTTETSIAKLYATEAAVECANKAIQVHGGSGYVDDYPVERYLRDARVTTLYEGTSQIQKLIIGRAVTGENALVP